MQEKEKEKECVRERRGNLRERKTKNVISNRTQYKTSGYICTCTCIDANLSL